MFRISVGNKDGIPAVKERITVRMTTEMIERIDAWIAHRPGYVSRQDAVRHSVDLMLGRPTSEGDLGSITGARAPGSAARSVD
jgi:Arc/MetJ-type ribon-helix-helix transcriptional regulator